jgi:NAD(P)-dependent dehydrogenase (short-subunit alcohol dehydrogenase family)
MATSVVLVTGALTGIGRATALAFAREGARVAVSGRNTEDGRALVAEMHDLGMDAVFLHSDVRYESEISNLIDEAVARFGRLDVAVNSAGTEGYPGPIVDQTAETYAVTFDTNVLGTLLCMKHELRVMLPRRCGCIVNLSSTLGQVTVPGTAVYAASKHAVEGLTKAAALEAAPFGVRVNAIAPGPVDTGMLTRLTASAERKNVLTAAVALKRLADPKEIADAIVFVASERASFVTGQIIGVDGGKMA